MTGEGGFNSFPSLKMPVVTLQWFINLDVQQNLYAPQSIQTLIAQTYGESYNQWLVKQHKDVDPRHLSAVTADQHCKSEWFAVESTEKGSRAEQNDQNLQYGVRSIIIFFKHPCAFKNEPLLGNVCAKRTVEGVMKHLAPPQVWTEPAGRKRGLRWVRQVGFFFLLLFKK